VHNKTLDLGRSLNTYHTNERMDA